MTATAAPTAIEVLSDKDLYERAAAFAGLPWTYGDDRPWRSHSTISTGTVTTYNLYQGGLLDRLKKDGFEFTVRPDKIRTLADRRRPPLIENGDTYVADYWNFPEDRELRFEVSYVMQISQDRRGVIVSPHVMGQGVSPANERTHYEAFRVIAEHDPEILGTTRLAPTIVLNRTAVVSWTDLGLGGLRPMFEIFAEFVNGRRNVESIAHHLRVFDPDPCPPGIHPPRFVPEPSQPPLLEAWRDQLAEFKRGL